MFEKNAVRPVISHVLEDVQYNIFGNPNFREFVKPREFLPGAITEEKGEYYVDPGVLYEFILGKYKPKKSVPGAKNEKKIKKYLKNYGFPELAEFSEHDKAKIKQILFLNSLANIFTPGAFDEILGYYSTWNDEEIRINKDVIRNAEQHLGLAQALYQLGNKQITVEPKKEKILFKTIYDAVITNGFLPAESPEEFQQKAKTDEKYRDRVIKALAFPAYGTLFHEAMHRKYLRGGGKYNYNYQIPLLYYVYDLGLAFEALTKKVKLNYDQQVWLLNEIDYASTGTELDAQLSLFKIWYYIQTGKKIKNIKDADYAMKYAAMVVAKHPELFTRGFPDVVFQTRLYSFISLSDYLLKQYAEEARKQKDTASVEVAERCRKDLNDVKAVQLYRLVQV